MGWKDADEHIQIMTAYLTSLSGYPCVFKGGSALRLCYGLDRMSEDLDFDSTNGNAIMNRINEVSAAFGHPARIAKNTETGQRYVIHYNEHSTLDIDVSCRLRVIPKESYTIYNGVAVYTLNEILMQKSVAQEKRNKARDLYDIAFILTQKRGYISPAILAHLANNVFGYDSLDDISFRFDNAKVDDKILKHVSGDEVALQIYHSLYELPI